MPTKPKKAKLTAHVIPVRLPHDLFARVHALAAVHGTQSTVLRAAIAEGVRILERRAKQDTNERAA